MSIDANALTQLNYICFRIDRPNFIKIDDPTAVISPCKRQDENVGKITIKRKTETNPQSLIQKKRRGSESDTFFCIESFRVQEEKEVAPKLKRTSRVTVSYVSVCVCVFPFFFFLPVRRYYSFSPFFRRQVSFHPRHCLPLTQCRWHQKQIIIQELASSLDTPARVRRERGDCVRARFEERGEVQQQQQQQQQQALLLSSLLLIVRRFIFSGRSPIFIISRPLSPLSTLFSHLPSVFFYVYPVPFVFSALPVRRHAPRMRFRVSCVEGRQAPVVTVVFQNDSLYTRRVYRVYSIPSPSTPASSSRFVFGGGLITIEVADTRSARIRFISRYTLCKQCAHPFPRDRSEGIRCY